MSTSDSGVTQNLTEEEMVLHHYAAMIEKNVEAYRESASKDVWQGLWGLTFKTLLVFRILAISCDLSELILF
jgi:hypothetical protein